MQVLHLDSSISGDASVSRALSAAIIAEITRQRTIDGDMVHVMQRDLVAQPVAHLDGLIAAGFRPLGHASSDDAVAREHAISEQLVTQLLASDVIVIGAPMYNFSVASQLKAWMDRIAQPGRTFQYTAQGPAGLAGERSVIIASARGGLYSSGPAAAMDFHEAYLKAFFGFLGIRHVSVVRAELLSKGETLKNESIRHATASIAGAVQHHFRN